MIRTILLTSAALGVAATANAQFAYEDDEKARRAEIADCMRERGLDPDGPVSPFCVARKNRVLSTIVTYGDRSPLSAGTVSIVNAETIERISADHPAEVLNTLPGG